MNNLHYFDLQHSQQTQQTQTHHNSFDYYQPIYYIDPNGSPTASNQQYQFNYNMYNPNGTGFYDTKFAPSLVSSVPGSSAAPASMPAASSASSASASSASSVASLSYSNDYLYSPPASIPQSLEYNFQSSFFAPDPISPTTTETSFGEAQNWYSPVRDLKGSPRRKSCTPILASNAKASKKPNRTSQPGPIPASQPTLSFDQESGRELVTFSYSRHKIITKWTIKCPKQGEKEKILASVSEKFLQDNCIYKRAFQDSPEQRSSRQNYEKSCNELGWQLCYLNPELTTSRGLLQRAVDSWRNTRKDEKVRSRRVRRENKLKSVI